MTTIIGTGISGLVGSRITELLSADFSFEEISRSTGIDITDNRSVLQKISSSNSPFVLHLAAKADVDGCELDKPLGVNGDAWKINVIGTKNIADACLQTGKKLLYISTDFVFDGEKADGYTEEDMPNPINWYAETKYEGEKIVSALSSP
ncbi:MAG: SDR family oxidoreductase, partial [Candidatus Levyibacteriota bacterium]